MKNKCAIILPYFGKFNNYFDLFLNSCRYNSNIDWLIYTDDKSKYPYPSNVHIHYIYYDDFISLLQSKFNFTIAVDSPHKLCDFKPVYGYVLEDALKQYDYWGHCDCDLIFGNMEETLDKLMNEEYDKIFASGHLTLYKNTAVNNRMFMRPYHGKLLYKEFLSKSETFAFDEDWKDENIHAIFLNEGAKVYCEDICINPSIEESKFILKKYDKKSRSYITLPYVKAMYVWDHGKVKQFFVDKKTHTLKCNQGLYMHLQQRRMKKCRNFDDSTQIFKIVPNHFVSLQKCPKSVCEWNCIVKNPPNLHKVKFYSKILKYKLMDLFNRKGN